MIRGCAASVVALIIVAAMMNTTALARPASPDWAIPWSTIDGGGGTSTEGAWTVTGTIGQPEAAVASGGSWAVSGGFFPTLPPCAGDTNGDGTVDVDDLLNVILDWDTNGSAHNGDADGSGAVDVDDLTTVILAWGPCW